MVVWFSYFLNTTLSRGRISLHLKIGTISGTLPLASLKAVS
jgi:hypothetical protein